MKHKAILAFLPVLSLGALGCAQDSNFEAPDGFSEKNDALNECVYWAASHQSATDDRS